MENKPKNRLVKGSQEAKDAMANLRSKRGGANKPPVEIPYHHQYQHNQLKYHNQNLNQEKI